MHPFEQLAAAINQTTARMRGAFGLGAGPLAPQPAFDPSTALTPEESLLWPDADAIAGARLSAQINKVQNIMGPPPKTDWASLFPKGPSLKNLAPSNVFNAAAVAWGASKVLGMAASAATIGDIQSANGGSFTGNTVGVGAVDPAASMAAMMQQAQQFSSKQTVEQLSAPLSRI